MPIQFSNAPRAYQDNTGYNVATGIGNTLRAGMGALSDYEKQKALEEAMRQEAMVKQMEMERTQGNADRQYELQKAGQDRSIARDDREAMLSDADRQLALDQQAGFSGALADQSEWMLNNPDAPDVMLRGNVQEVAGKRGLIPENAIRFNTLQKQQVDQLELAAAKAQYAEDLASKNNASRERIAALARQAAQGRVKPDTFPIPTTEEAANYYEKLAEDYETKANEGAAQPSGTPATEVSKRMATLSATLRSKVDAYRGQNLPRK